MRKSEQIPTSQFFFLRHLTPKQTLKIRIPLKNYNILRNLFLLKNNITKTINIFFFNLTYQSKLIVRNKIHNLSIHKNSCEIQYFEWKPSLQIKSLFFIGPSKKIVGLIEFLIGSRFDSNRKA